jgi:hypothetical protein
MEAEEFSKIRMTPGEESWASWKCDGGPHQPSIPPEGFIGHSRPMTQDDKVRLGWIAVDYEQQ